MIQCTSRGTECHCSDNECAFAPVRPYEAAISFSIWDYLPVIAFAIVMALLTAGTMHALNQQEIQLAQEARV